MEDKSDLLMLSGVVAGCAECGVERVFVPVDAGDPGGEHCCTSCDAAVFLMSFPALRRSRRRRTSSAA
jgi:hypothetical protein